MKTTLTEMKNADVHFVSLVDRGANRIPIRILKSDKEPHMIDLNSPGKVLKAALKPAAPAAPSVIGIVVNKHEDPATAEKVRVALSDAGYDVTQVVENEDGTLLYKQEAEIVAEGSHLVRLSDEMVLVVKGFQPYCSDLDSSSDFNEVLATKGFYSGLYSATDALGDVIRAVLQNSKSGAEAAKELSGTFSKFTTYVTTLLNGIPSKAFKAEEAVAEVVKSADKKDPKDADKVKPEDGDKKPEGKDKAPEDSTADKVKEPAKAKKEGEGVEGDPVEGAPVVAAAPAVAEPVAAAPAAAEPAAAVSPMEALKAELADLLKPITTGLADLTSTVTKTAEDQKELAERVDGIARKTEDATKAIKSTVVATAVGGDEKPAPVQARKSDDPRTGAFDSANFRRTQR